MEITGQVTRSILSQGVDQSEVGNARRTALSLATGLDFDERRCGELGIVVTEAARNLSSHGGGGEILLTPWIAGSAAGVDILALDRGRGIADIAQALQDGFSTGGTPGTGLGAIERLSDVFQIYSQAKGGTAIFARLLRSKAALEAVPDYGSVAVPFGEERVSGDGWVMHIAQERTVYMMVDGLGHGPMAHEAATRAIQAFEQQAYLSPVPLLQAVHLALQGTRGAAVAVAEILHHRGTLAYAGCGNIVACLFDGNKVRNLVSMNGTPGHNIGTLQEFTYSVSPNSFLIMHSDGIQTRYGLTEYPGLMQRHPALLAGLLYRDFSRKRDDATILVVRLPK